ncbi:alpha-D-ribose 1-methylphosphonate 5-triphosphate diphosphatase [Roseobacter sp. YSTF-M11]|uniref:Alpha-D-ribose 1-methylphosphonate 5-triphosphate diphosphatase n=1 Tax=Roseobacter insulae TaxID=2859783 RepID=A0A9X1FTR3_9RHOB|nr:alpha-D-ribose 1-methylphosphonate 5-triphosphate diphosphatase [Roseobacter insulae]MBW4707366.1 alpha-D-ribose 1-methylphosphonate 5-triphosphate diphosphatase [Roseobacter insulae]
MKQHVQPLRLIGAHVLRDGDIASGEICIEEGRIRDHSTSARSQTLTLSGYYLLPGIIDLHGDAFERHIAPRPTAPFPLEMGLVGTDRDAATSGVTTAWMAQSWSWEGGMRGPDFAEQFLTAHRVYKAQMLTDLRVQLRCETHTMDTRARLIEAVKQHGVGYVVFNNHLDEATTLAATHPDQIRDWAKRAGRTPEEHMALVNGMQARSAEVPRYLCDLATAFDQQGVKYGSHDDPDARTRERYAMIGAKICEFPTHVDAAAAAKSWGDPVLMGAPNVVRGGSQAGNISAMVLIREGLCTALVSDFHYPTLARAAFRIADDGVLPLASAWALISARPARIMGLEDRGVIAEGKRADLTIINAETRQIEGTMAAGRWSYISAELVNRLSHPQKPHRIAAE